MLFCIVTFNLWLHFNKLLTYLLTYVVLLLGLHSIVIVKLRFTWRWVVLSVLTCFHVRVNVYGGTLAIVGVWKISWWLFLFNYFLFVIYYPVQCKVSKNSVYNYAPLPLRCCFGVCDVFHFVVNEVHNCQFMAYVFCLLFLGNAETKPLGYMAHRDFLHHCTLYILLLSKWSKVNVDLYSA